MCKDDEQFRLLAKYETYKMSRCFLDIEDMIDTRDMSFSEFCAVEKEKERAKLNEARSNTK